MRKFGVVLASVGLAFGLVGCSSSDGGSEPTAVGSPRAAQLEQKAPEQAKDARAAQLDTSARDGVVPLDRHSAKTSGGQAKEPQETLEKLGSTSRKLARTASMKLRVKDIDEAAADARAIAARAGGYTGSERTRDKHARLTLTVPGSKLDAVLDELEELGKRVERDIGVQDVTEAVVDVDARVKTQQRSVRRTLLLLDRAQTISQILAIEHQLAVREARLESLLKRQEALHGQVSMAPIELSILPREDRPDLAAADDEPGGFGAGLAAGWSAFTTGLAAVATGLGAFAPFLLVGVPALVLLWVWRRRRSTQAPEAAAGVSST